jgi:ATP-dependent Clp protease ATP-binding subunit ClpA
VLFDEIEKASDALWQLLLGILDKATLTLGDNRRVDFSRCIIIMTSNLGTKEMSLATDGSVGFAPSFVLNSELNTKLKKIGIEAARRKFSPEFLNRLDKIVVFHSLPESAMRRILDLELKAVQRRIFTAGRGPFLFSCSDSAKTFLLKEGHDPRYGARPLKRAVEHHILLPISNLIATRQISAGDVLLVDTNDAEQELCFKKACGLPHAIEYDNSVEPGLDYALAQMPTMGF